MVTITIPFDESDDIVPNEQDETVSNELVKEVAGSSVVAGSSIASFVASGNICSPFNGTTDVVVCILPLA
jgi:hypothetical protein